MNPDEIHQFTYLLVEEVNRERTELQGFDIQADVWSDRDKEILQSSLEDVLRKRGIVVCGQPDYCESPDGWLRRLGISGIYFPFSFQAHGDGSYLALSKYFIYCHELSHAYGVSHEAEADLFAYYALKHACKHGMMSDQCMRFSYAADIELLRSLRSRMKKMNDGSLEKVDAALLPQVKGDLAALRKNAEAFEEIIPGVSNTMNDAYLRTMGVSEGIESYERFVELLWMECGNCY